MMQKGRGAVRREDEEIVGSVKTERMFVF